jgi:hypothetical protein
MVAEGSTGRRRNGVLSLRLFIFYKKDSKNWMRYGAQIVWEYRFLLLLAPVDS